MDLSKYIEILSNIPQPKKELTTIDEVLRYLINELFAYIQNVLQFMQHQIIRQKQQLEKDLLFYQNLIIPNQYIESNIYTKLQLQLSHLTDALRSSWTKKTVLIFIKKVLQLVEEYQINMQEFYDPIIQKKQFIHLFNSKYKDVLELILKKFPNTQSQHENDILTIIPQREHIKLIKQAEIIQLNILYDKLSSLSIYKRSVLKSELFWTKPEVIQLLHIYLYNDNIDITISNIICSDIFKKIVKDILKIAYSELLSRNITLDYYFELPTSK